MTVEPEVLPPAIADAAKADQSKVRSDFLPILRMFLARGFIDPA